MDQPTVSLLLAVCCGLELTVSSSTTVQADAPRIVVQFPSHGQADVDPDLTKLRVTFDRDMRTGRWSFCGGGPSFPRVVGDAKWIDARTIVLAVKLQRDHHYQMSLNCPSSDKNFRSASDGVPLPFMPWSFTTSAKSRRLSSVEQRELNARSLSSLMTVLRDEYSYYELRWLDWDGVEAEHRDKILAAKSTPSWIKRTARMLSAANDMHLWFSYRGDTTPTYKRRIKRNFDLNGVRSVLPGLSKRNPSVYTARSNDNIGYIMIATLGSERAEELEQVQDVLSAYRDCKALILDLRPNGGGAESLAKPIAAWFVNGTQVYAKHRVRNPKAADGFDPVRLRSITGNPPPRRFEKPVAVLAGPGIMSSAEAFLLMLRQGRNVKLIGAASFGSSGNPKPHLLENGVELYVPSWQAMRPDGSVFEGEGIAPDIIVEARPGEFKKGDPVLQRALSYLRSVTK